MKLWQQLGNRARRFLSSPLRQRAARRGTPRHHARAHSRPAAASRSVWEGEEEPGQHRLTLSTRRPGHIPRPASAATAAARRAPARERGGEPQLVSAARATVPRTASGFAPSSRHRAPAARRNPAAARSHPKPASGISGTSQSAPMRTPRARAPPARAAQGATAARTATVSRTRTRRG